MSKVQIFANDRKLGMTPAEVRRAVHEVDTRAKITVDVTWRGGIKSITVEPPLRGSPNET